MVKRLYIACQPRTQRRFLLEEVKCNLFIPSEPGRTIRQSICVTQEKLLHENVFASEYVFFLYTKVNYVTMKGVCRDTRKH